MVANVDCTVSAKLYACEILADCLKTQYSQWQEGDRLQFRQALLVAAQSQARMSLVPQHNTPQAARGAAAAVDGGGNSSLSASLPLANKLASLIAGLVVRDFPQRWPTCVEDLFTQLWSATTPTTTEQQLSPRVGNKMCLQVLQLVAEDCTDSDFNSKVRMLFYLFFVTSSKAPNEADPTPPPFPALLLCTTCAFSSHLSSNRPLILLNLFFFPLDLHQPSE